METDKTIYPVATEILCPLHKIYFPTFCLWGNIFVEQYFELFLSTHSVLNAAYVVLLIIENARFVLFMWRLMQNVFRIAFFFAFYYVCIHNLQNTRNNFILFVINSVHIKIFVAYVTRISFDSLLV